MSKVPLYLTVIRNGVVSKTRSSVAFFFALFVQLRSLDRIFFSPSEVLCYRRHRFHDTIVSSTHKMTRNDALLLYLTPRCPDLTTRWCTRDGSPRGKRALKVGICSTVFGVRVYGEDMQSPTPPPGAGQRLLRERNNLNGHCERLSQWRRFPRFWEE